MSTNSENDGRLPALVLGAIGVVFGDIGTSPLYAIKESFYAFHLPADALHIYGLMSLIFWLLTLIVSVKYVSFIMRADNKGEGGNLALLALARRLTRKNPSLFNILGLLGIVGGSLFFADAVITPAISVMSAVEGLEIVAPSLTPFILPVSITILFVLFAVQRHGTDKIGGLFGPVTLIWFVTLGILGLRSIIETPHILEAANPLYAWAFFLKHPLLSFWTLGAAVLAVTGAEALYADMGHFGKKPIQIGWFFIIWPCLLLNYFGQAALLIRVPQAMSNPFYLLAPEALMIPLLVLATAATIIASQAVITGTFSVTRQAILLGFLPRLQIKHTSDETKGQIFIPTVNWLLFATILILIVSFKSSSALAAAYGLAITGDMIITSILFLVVARLLWRWSLVYIAAFIAFFLSVEIALFGANLIKIAHGAWLPIVISIILVTLFTTWSRGQKLLTEQTRRNAIAPDAFIASLDMNYFAKVPGTAFYLTRQRAMVPPSFLVQMRHTKVLHEQVVFLTVQIEEDAYVTMRDRCDYHSYGRGFHRIILHYGFKETPNLQEDLQLARVHGFNFDMSRSSFFIGTESIVPIEGHGMPIWRDWIFMMMKRNSGDVITYLNLPYDRVIELKSQHIV